MVSEVLLSFLPSVVALTRIMVVMLAALVLQSRIMHLLMRSVVILVVPLLRILLLHLLTIPAMLSSLVIPVFGTREIAFGTGLIA